MTDHNLRPMPAASAEQRRTMEQMFRHHVFEPGGETSDHIPEKARRVLAPMDEGRVHEMRAYLLSRLNR